MGLLIACLDDPGSADLAKRIVASGRSDIRVLGYGSADAQEVEAGTAFEPVHGVEVGVRLLGFHAHDVGGSPCSSTWRARAPREPCGWQCRVVTWRSTHLRLYWLPVTPAPRRRRSSRGSAGFGGVHRRFQFTGRERGVRVFDDYAHHPTEVRAVLGAAADLVRPEGRFVRRPIRPAGRVIVVFQPHLYSRTAAFCRGSSRRRWTWPTRFVVLDVYGASRRADAGRQWCAGRSVGHETCSLSTGSVHRRRKQVAASLAHPGDIVITMGAGDVTMLGKQILDALRSAPHPAPR